MEEKIKINDNFNDINDVEVCELTRSCMTINTFSLLGLVYYGRESDRFYNRKVEIEREGEKRGERVNK